MDNESHIGGGFFAPRALTADEIQALGSGGDPTKVLKGPVYFLSWDPTKRLLDWKLIEATEPGDAEMRAVRDIVEGQVSGH